MSPAANLTGKAQAYTVSSNRRVHMLAVNHRRQMQRRAAAIAGHRPRRDLSDVYRRQKSKPMNARSRRTAGRPEGGRSCPLVNRYLP